MENFKPIQEVANPENVIERENSEKIKAVLDEIDFDVIETIFSEITNKSEVNISATESIHVRKFIGKASVRNTLTDESLTETSPLTLAITKYILVDQPDKEFSTLEPVIEFNPSATVLATGNLDDKKYFAYILKALIHEQVHATQFRGNLNVSEKNGTRTSTHINGVLESVSRYTIDGEDLDLEVDQLANNLLNEGLVEKIADYITEEYLKRVGKTGLLTSFFQAYPAGRMLVELLVHKIVTETGVSKDGVFNALVRGSYEGVSLLGGDLDAQFEEGVKKFLKNYKYLDRKNEDYDEKELALCEEFIKTIDLEKVLDPAIVKLLHKKNLV